MEIVLALIFASVVMFGLAVANFGPRPEQRRLARLAGGQKPAEVDTQGVLTRQELTWFDKLMQPFAGNQDRMSEETLGPIRRRLTYAGFRRDSALMTYLGSRVVFALVLPLLVLMTPATWTFGQLQLVMAL